MELLRSARTQGQTLVVAGLEAGVLYRVKTSYQGCGTNVSTTLTVKTGKAPSQRPTLACALVFLYQFHGLSTSHCSSYNQGTRSH